MKLWRSITMGAVLLGTVACEAKRAPLSPEPRQEEADASREDAAKSKEEDRRDASDVAIEGGGVEASGGPSRPEPGRTTGSDELQAGYVDEPDELVPMEEAEEEEPAVASLDDQEIAETTTARLESKPSKRKERQQQARPRFSPSGASASGGAAGRVDLDSLEAARAAYESGAGAIDLDGDGRADWYPSSTRDADGLPSVEYLDVDGDSRPDLTVTTEDGVRREALDMDHDGSVERLVTASVDDSGAVVREQLDDTDGDGVFDLRVRTTVDVAAGVSIRKQWTASREGWTLLSERTLPLDQPSLARVATTGAGACSPAQARQAKKALDAAIAKGHECLSRTDPTLSMQVLRRLVTSQVEIQCGWDLQRLNACAVSPGASLARAWTGRGPVDIRLSSLAFSPAAGCDPLDALLFHELLHYVVGIHPSVEGRADPGDRVFGCQETCFGVATSQSCAACRGSRNGDTQCSAYPQLSCEGEPPGLCSSDGALHASVDSCAQSCSGSCMSRGPCRP